MSVITFYMSRYFKIRKKNQRLTRWGLILQEYNPIIKHIKGKDNVIADALSRVG